MQSVCKHGARSTPATCSQCLHAPARVVSIDGRDVLLDGKPTGRQVDAEKPRVTARKRSKR